MKPIGILPDKALRLTLAAVTVAVLSVNLATGPAQAVTMETRLSEALGSQDVGPPSVTLPAGWRHDMLTRVNAIREGAGLEPLRPCASLRRSAQDYAVLMAATNVLGHLSPDGTTPWDRMRAQGFSWQAAAENVASGQTSIEDVMRQWVESPEHYRNLLDPRMHQVGFGFAVNPKTGTPAYWVQDFGAGTGC